MGLWVWRAEIQLISGRNRGSDPLINYKRMTVKNPDTVESRALMCVYNVEINFSQKVKVYTHKIFPTKSEKASMCFKTCDFTVFIKYSIYCIVTSFNMRY